MKKFVAMLLALMMVLSLAACGAPADDQGGADDGYKIAIVPKMTSIAWFERMEAGIKDYNAAKGTNYFYGGSSDGAGQAAYVEGLLAQDYDAICVVPFDTEALEPILQKAREQGIVVITHEAAGMKNIDYDVEAFDNEDYGRHFMEQIGAAVGGKGEYIQFVGSLTSASHMQWTGAAEELQKTKFPEMKLHAVLESADDQDQAYNKTKEALTANPNIIAIQGSGMGDVAGAARAVEEMGLGGKAIDFEDKANPVVNKVDVDFEEKGYSLCIVDTKGSHDDLTDEYAAVPYEVKKVAEFFGKEVLREVDEAEFMANIPALREKLGDRAILRAIHFFGDNARVADQVAALADGEFEKFLGMIKASGDSSYKYLQNVYTTKDVQAQNVSIALAVSEKVLGDNGVCRVHGGGFAGTIQAFVKNEFVPTYKAALDNVFGPGSCHVLKVRKYGGMKIM